MEVIKKYKWLILFMIMLVTQCMYMIFWGTQKSGYYVDEFFTYDNAHYLSGSTSDRVKLYDADFLEYDKWLSVEEMKGTLTVKAEESLLQDSLSYNISVFLNQKPYMAVLNYVEAIFFDGELNWWSALSINIVCFLLNQIFLYLLVMRLCHRRTAALLSMALYGFCGMAVSMLVYVRMYMWLTLLMTVFTYIHMLMWDEQKIWKNILYEVLSLPFLYLAFKNSPLPVIYAAALIGCFFVGLLLRKRWLQALYYGIPLLGGGALYGVTQTEYVRILMNPKKVLESGELDAAVFSLVKNMADLNRENIIMRIENVGHMICRFLFGHALVAGILILICLSMIVMAFWKKCKWIEKLRKEKIEFVFIIMAAIVLYFMAAVVFDLESIRYNSFVFPQIAVCISVMIISIAHMLKVEKTVIGVGIVMIVMEIYFTGSIPRIENLYMEDKEAVNAVMQCEGIDSLVIDYQFDDRIMYECLAYTDENTNVMFSYFGKTDYSQLTEQLLVWQTVNQAPDELREELVRGGYKEVEQIAETHESRVFLCLK